MRPVTPQTQGDLTLAPSDSLAAPPGTSAGRRGASMLAAIPCVHACILAARPSGEIHINEDWTCLISHEGLLGSSLVGRRSIHCLFHLSYKAGIRILGSDCDPAMRMSITEVDSGIEGPGGD